VDTQGISLQHISYENHHRDARAMGSMEDFYPQLLQCIYICNPPSWVQIPWRVIRALAPKRVVSKVDFIDPRHNKHDLKKIMSFISLEHLPTQFGGKNENWPASFPLPNDDISETFSGSESDVSSVAIESQCRCRAALLYSGSLEMDESSV
jgi:hypothetical protein